MGDGLQMVEQVLKLRIINQQRIATRENDLAERRVSLHGGQCSRRTCWRGSTFGIRKFSPKAVAAVDRTATSQQQQAAAGVFLQHATRPTGMVFGKWIGRKARNLMQFVWLGKNLQ
jgi:hypothetical protein